MIPAPDTNQNQAPRKTAAEDYREWLRILDEDVIQGVHGFESGEFTVYPDHWRPLFDEGLTPSQAWQRAVAAQKKSREAAEAQDANLKFQIDCAVAQAKGRE